MRGCKQLGFEICALFDSIIETIFTPAFISIPFNVVLVYNISRLISQMDMTKKNMTNLDLNLGQLVRSVPDWVGFCVV